MQIQVIDEKQILKNLYSQKNPFFTDYLAFYSTWLGGITTHPSLMLLPIDDHMVHRGDGVFEAMKAVGRAVYLFEQHLNRLIQSAKAISLESPYSIEQIKTIVLETLRVANQDNAIIRIFLSRGPGNFSVNPYDSVGAQLYVVVTHLKLPAAEKYEKGVAIGQSNVHIKDAWMAQVKSCNYLQNVMMKKEAVDRKLDYVIGVDDKECITEGSTENIMIVDKNGAIVHPELDNILKGTTMIRACELARANGIATEVRSIALEDLKTAREVMMCGTTLDVLPVTQFENYKIADGKPGPIAKQLRKLILEDIKKGVRY